MPEAIDGFTSAWVPEEDEPFDGDPLDAVEGVVRAWDRGTIGDHPDGNEERDDDD